MSGFDVVLVVMDNTERTHAVVAELLAQGKRVAVAGKDRAELVAYCRPELANKCAVFVADPFDPHQVDLLIERIGDRLGQITLVIDPSGQLAAAEHCDTLAA